MDTLDVPARLRPQGFGRHTFLCGQSGSGRTYALGVVLEPLTRMNSPADIAEGEALVG